MKNGLKKFIIVAIIISLRIASEGVYAMVESRPGEPTLRGIDVNEAFIRIRKLEEEGEALGLTAIVDEYGNEAVSNNIDAHMMKSTEWGAVAYLAQSIYGKGTDNSITDSGTTTGGSGGNYITNFRHSTTQNPYGVYGMVTRSHRTLVAAHHTSFNNDSISTLFAARLRYKDIYTTTDQSDIPGGATTETYNWYGQQYTSTNRYFNSSRPILIRNYSTDYWGLFSYATYSGSASTSYKSRITVICGAGL